MTYNVFGGTLNLTQPELIIFLQWTADFTDSHIISQFICYCCRHHFYYR